MGTITKVCKKLKELVRGIKRKNVSLLNSKVFFFNTICFFFCFFLFCFKYFFSNRNNFNQVLIFLKNNPDTSYVFWLFVYCQVFVCLSVLLLLSA
jgi:formate/nitrite transporter FocA (FNT family)